MLYNKIEILSVELLDQQRPLVNELRSLAAVCAWILAGITCWT